MEDEGSRFRDIVELCRYWNPSESGKTDEAYTQDLSEFLDTRMSGRELIGSHDKNFSADGNTIQASGIVIEVIKEFSCREDISQQALEGRRSIVVSCGMESPDTWKRLQEELRGTDRHRRQIEFLWKPEKLFGRTRAENQKKGGVGEML